VWVADYNGDRPHSSLKYLTPAAATRRTKPQDSNRHWMNIQWQVSD
jgi:hypothetical protein